ncbi:hypothetical protein BH11PLA2_BH11PLA2_48360 [soil metagenome]
MPMRDHFRPIPTWQPVHGGWPMAICIQLFSILPEGFVAEPRVNLGPYFEIDIATFEKDVPEPWQELDAGGGTALATWAPAKPAVTMETSITEVAEYEVLIFDEENNRQLVAAIELVSPSNKDRPESRQAFVSKCLALLSKGVCVTIVDLVTIRNFNLYYDLTTLAGHRAHSNGKPIPSTYAVTCRVRKDHPKSMFDAWPHSLTVGQPLPELPIWLREDFAIPLNLEASYEETCRVLRIK